MYIRATICVREFILWTVLCKYIIHLMRFVTRTTHMTYINSYMFRHRYAIFRELLQKRCASQHANIFMYCKLTKFFVFLTCFQHHVYITGKTVCTCSFLVCFSCIYVSGLVGGRMCIKNCMYKWSTWWWTHDIRNMQKTQRIELKH